MIKIHKKILLFVGVIIVISVSIFAYQTYFSMPEFENTTLVEGLQISLPIDSIFVSNGANTFHDDKTGLTIKVLKSENDIIDANVSNPKETINNGSNTVKIFENYTVVTDENNVGIKISNITDENKNIAMEIAENVILSSSLKSKKIGEEKATEIGKKLSDYIYKSLSNGMFSNADAFSYTFTGITLTKYRGKTVYNATFVGIVSAYGMTDPPKTENYYIDAYTGKIINSKGVEDFNKQTVPKIMS
ncbi:MAG: hypothetical protein FWH54_00835 [Methanobrevibacter sp.]|nr:hypothetical protein [Methanobrevibacter sp.]